MRIILNTLKDVEEVEEVKEIDGKVTGVTGRGSFCHVMILLKRMLKHLYPVLLSCLSKEMLFWNMKAPQNGPKLKLLQNIW